MGLQNAADYKVASAITSTGEPYLMVWTDGKYEDDNLYLLRKSAKMINTFEMRINLSVNIQRKKN